jgi:hypothetical protein
LTGDEARRRPEGPNAIAEETPSLRRGLLAKLRVPMPRLLETAIILQL